MVLSEPVAALSNIFRWRDGGPSQPATAHLAAPEEILPALRILLGSNGYPAEHSAVNDFSSFAAERGLDLRQMWITSLGGRITAACLPVPSPGGTALLMTSTAGSSRGLATDIAACVQAATGALHGTPHRLAQLLLEPGEQKTADAMRAIGFDDLATLLYLQRSVPRVPKPPTLPEGIEVITYSAATHPQFARAIAASYEDSLDCPRLHGQRDIEDVIAGHKASGAFEPDLWFCLIDGVRSDASEPTGEPLGVLLLAPIPGHRTMELVYVGLARSGRGRKLGDYLLSLALERTARAGLDQLTLAVDQSNAPALRLYYRHGLGEIHRRLAMLKIVSG
jgi:ribosomal protein S18 acetylase RimI-like enzyme